MAGVLNFDQFVSGADNIITEQMFPNQRRTLVYDFDQDISGWNFSADFQTIVVDSVTFNRNTGRPNFANSTVLGSFPKQELGSFSGGTYIPTVINATTGTVRVTHPDQMYDGPLYPDARSNVVIVIYSFQWEDDSTPITNVNMHRYALVQAWEPDVALGDPTTHTDYTALS